MGTGGIAAGGVQVMEAFKQELEAAGVKDATINERCKMHKVGCRGFCAKDVLVDINVGEETSTYQYIEGKMVKRLVEEHIQGGQPVTEWLVQDDYHTFHDNQEKIILHDLGRIDPESIDDYLAVDGYQAVREVLKSMKPAEVIDTIKEAGLRGRGGAGFLTGVKWGFCAANDDEQKYIICNADEGDPGAFMDRSIIEGNPHAVIEGGMIIGAYAIGASVGYIYIRAEYPLAVERLEIALAAAREKGYLGEKICGSDFNFDLKIKLVPEPLSAEPLR